MIKVRVVYPDGSTSDEFRVGPRHRVELERHFKHPFWDLVGKGAKHPSEDAVYYLGHTALRLAGDEIDDYETWLERIDDVEIWNEDGPAANPTERAPKPAKSSS